MIFSFLHCRLPSPWKKVKTESYCERTEHIQIILRAIENANTFLRAVA